jgi:hypothetical protein
MSAPTSIAFIANRPQWDMVAPHQPEIVASGDFGVLEDARARGLRTVDLWHYLGAEEYEDIRSRCWNACDQAAAALAGLIVVGPCDIIERSRYDLVWTLQAVENISRVVSRALAGDTPYEIWHFTEGAIAHFGDPPVEPGDVFNACVRHVAEQRKWPRREFKLPPLPAPVLVMPALGDPAPNPLMAEQARVLCTTTPYGVYEADHLFRQAAATAPMEWLTLTEDQIPHALPNIGLRYIRWLPLSNLGLEARVQAWGAEARARLESAWRDIGRRLFENQHLAFVWEAWARVWFSAVRAYVDGSFLVQAVNPRLVLTGWDVSGPLRCQAQAFLDAGAPVVSVDHGGCEIRADFDLFRGTRTHLAAWGPLGGAGKQQVKIDGARVRSVGTMRGQPPPPPRPSAMPPERLVIFTGQTIMGGRMVGWCPPDQLRHGWDVMVDVLRRRSGAEVLLKPHPRYDWPDFYRRVVLPRLPNARMVDGFAAHWLQDARAALLINAPSSVLGEIIGAGVPAIYLKTGVMSWADSVIEQGGVVVCRSAEELQQALTDCGDPVRRAEILRQQQDFMQRLQVATGESAVQRLLDFMAEMERPESGPPKDAARWVLVLVQALYREATGAGSGPVAFRAWLQRHRSGFCEAWRSEAWMDWSQLGPRLLTMVTWAEHPPVAWRDTLVQILAHELPESLRPAQVVYDNHLYEVLAQMRASAPDAGTRWRLTGRLWMLNVRRSCAKLRQKR